jgi:hypothetical protein
MGYSYKDSSGGGGTLASSTEPEALGEMQSRVNAGLFQPDANKTPMKQTVGNSAVPVPSPSSDEDTRSHLRESHGTHPAALAPSSHPEVTHNMLHAAGVANHIHGFSSDPKYRHNPATEREWSGQGPLGPVN